MINFSRCDNCVAKQLFPGVGDMGEGPESLTHSAVGCKALFF